MKGRMSWVPVTYFNLPKGTQPGDEQNIKRAKNMIEALTGAEEVNVSLNKTAAGTELPDQYAIELKMPASIGNYISLDGVEGLVKNSDLNTNQANALAEVIKGLASGKDVSEALDKLKAPANGDEAGDDGMVKDDPAKGQEAAPPPPPPSPGGPGPAGPPKRPPMASKVPSPEVCARLFSKETGLTPNEALGHVRRIRRCRNIDEAIKMLASNKKGFGIRVASTGARYPRKDYEDMCRMAWGIPPKGANRRSMGKGQSTAGVQTQELVNELSNTYGLDPTVAPDLIQHVVDKLSQDPEEQRVPMGTSAPQPTAGRRPLGRRG